MYFVRCYAFVQQATTITEDDQFLLLACDGLFDVFTPEDVVSCVRANMEKHGDAQKCCQVEIMNQRHNIHIGIGISLTHLCVLIYIIMTYSNNDILIFACYLSSLLTYLLFYRI